MKKKKVIACMLAVVAMLSMTGCGVKDWFKKKTAPVEEPPVCDVHTDVDDDGVCDVCGSVDFSYHESIWDI